MYDVICDNILYRLLSSVIFLYPDLASNDARMKNLSSVGTVLKIQEKRKKEKKQFLEKVAPSQGNF